MCTDLTTSRRSWRPFDRRVRTTWSINWRRGSRRSLERPGPMGWRSVSGNGRSSRWPADSCANSPLVLVLDEPTAALDAETEHALFERFAAAAREGRSTNGDQALGRITILVSHRFSTVRMADLIVVLDGSRVVEVGSHEELVGKGGHYARALWDSGGGLQVGESALRTSLDSAALVSVP